MTLGAGDCLGFYEKGTMLEMDGNATLPGREMHPRAYFATFEKESRPLQRCDVVGYYQRFFSPAPISVRAVWEAALQPENRLEDFCSPVRELPLLKLFFEQDPYSNEYLVAKFCFDDPVFLPCFQ